MGYHSAKTFHDADTESKAATGLESQIGTCINPGDEGHHTSTYSCDIVRLINCVILLPFSYNHLKERLCFCRYDLADWFSRSAESSRFALLPSLELERPSQNPTTFQSFQKADTHVIPTELSRLLGIAPVRRLLWKKLQDRKCRERWPSKHDRTCISVAIEIA